MEDNVKETEEKQTQTAEPETSAENHTEEQDTAKTADAAAKEPEKKENFELSPEDQISALKNELEDVKKLRLLALAEIDNLRKRQAREMQALRYNVTQDTIFPFLTVFDHFTMAFASAESSKTAASMDAFMKGMNMIQQEFAKAFDELGIEVIDAVGKEFDPLLHEAVANEPSDTVPAGIVIRQWSRGFKNGDKLLKAAMVVVSAGPAKKEESASAETTDSENKQ